MQSCSATTKADALYQSTFLSIENTERNSGTMATYSNTNVDDGIERPLRCRLGTQGLVIAQMALGSLLVILEIIGLGLGIYMADLVTYSGGGIWSGLFFVLTGTIGLLAMAPRPTLPAIRKKRLITFLVLSIISSIIAVALAIFSFFSFALFPLLYRIYPMDSMTTSSWNDRSDVDRVYLSFQVVRITSLIAYLVLLVCFIVSAAFGCCNVCRSSKSSPGLPHGQYVIYQVHPNAPVPQPPTGLSANYGAQFPVTFPLDGEAESFAPNSPGLPPYSKELEQRSLL